MRFVDTNVVLYSASRDPDERERAERAREILSARDLALSTQVLQELYVQATRTSRAGRLTHEQARRLVESLLRFPVAETTPTLVLAATDTARRFQISYWDAAIVAAARALDCDTLLSEDLNAGQDYGGIVVENPFA